MKKIFVISILASAFFCQSTLSFAKSNDKLNIAGVYDCTGFDSHDGSYNGVVILTLDAKASDFSHNFGAYTLKLTEGHGSEATTFSGEVAAHGDELAIYFANNGKNTIDMIDHGVGIAHVTHDQNSEGKFTTSFHKLYYEPSYQRNQKGETGLTGGRGTEVCVKRG
ncbi:MAG: hypothetical protein HKM04_04080 [Legionellales bacterium]|nr:hypothetical protein [Legionellales bacterium]